MIKNISVSYDPCNRIIVSFTQGASFMLFIYGIIILLEIKLNKVEFIVIMVFITLEFIAHIKVFIVLLFLTLLPLLCILLCIYACCCQKKEKPAKLPDPVPATVEILRNCDGDDCSICFQSMILG